MRNHIKLATQTISGIFAVLAFAFVFPTSAHAQQQICGNGGSGYCINDWNGGGAGSPVKMYNGGNSHEDFVGVHLTGACGGGVVTSIPGCPFADDNIDTVLQGEYIMEIKYVPNGKCVATNSNGQAVLGTCADNNGNGGSLGVINSWEKITGCNGATQGVLVNRYWTDQQNSTSGWASGGNPGTPLYLFANLGTCWGGL